MMLSSPQTPPERREEKQVADTFTIDLHGGQETPPTGSAAGGFGTVFWNAANLTATYSITVRDVDFGPWLPGVGAQTATTRDDVTQMHVHSAPPNVAGPIVFGQIGPAQDADLGIALNGDGSWTISGIWDASDPANAPIGG